MNLTKYPFAIAIISILFLTTGCQTNNVKPVEDVNLISLNYVAADHLIAAAASDLSTSHPILTTSFANIDDLKSSSTFGRITGEQVGSRFSQNGYSVVEMKVRNSVFIKEQSGEFILSRELKTLSTLHDAQAVLVGTYAVGSASVYVTAKLIATKDNIVIASYDYILPMGPDTKALLRK
ncbi:MAG: hypothetical protein IBX57_03075 [Gammaproteobacteria bacterium]|nr:hypothetical protein [Gammaproteobacteria bacterium]